MQLKADYASTGEDKLLVDYHPEGALIVRKVTCKARFEKWLDD
jgi:hypothetical protein